MKAVIYARYSSDNQREESIEAQIRAINEFAIKNNYEIVNTYIDEALTATTDNRPQFLKMIRDSSNRLFDIVICHKLDRFARNRYDSAFYKKELKDNGVRLVSVLEYFDDSPESIILESVLEGMAEYYSANLAREVKKGLKENALQCKHTGGKPPFGYDVDTDKNYIINKHEAEAVKKVFEMAAAGHTNICSWLNINGYRNKYGGVFKSAVISDMIKNEKYIGIYTYNQYKRQKINGVTKDVKQPDNEIIRIPGGIPAIVSEELWEAANSMIKKSKKAERNNSKITYLLSGLIACGECGMSYAGDRAPARGNRKERIVYRCIGEKKNKTCKNKAIRQDLVEFIVIEELDRLLSEEGIEQMVDILYKDLSKKMMDLPSVIKKHELELDKTTKDIDKLIDMALSTSFNDSIKNKLELLEIKKSDLMSKIEFQRIELGKIILPPKEFLKERLQNDIHIKEKSPEEQKRIIKTYINKVLIYPDYIEIYADRGLSYGAEGNRTPVRKPIHCSISHHSQSFNIPSV
jgi:site-specific DNA recombinase